jgi:hypothetical protein
MRKLQAEGIGAAIANSGRRWVVTVQRRKPEWPALWKWRWVHPMVWGVGGVEGKWEWRGE